MGTEKLWSEKKKKECSKEYVKSNELEIEDYLIWKKLNFNHIPVPISKNLRNEEEEDVHLYMWILHKIFSWNWSLSKRKSNILWNMLRIQMTSVLT